MVRGEAAFTKDSEKDKQGIKDNQSSDKSISIVAHSRTGKRDKKAEDNKPENKRGIV